MTFKEMFATPGEKDDEDIQDEDLSDHITVKGIAWSYLKFKLADNEFDYVTFAVSFGLY